jgi:hypothetical protein
MTNLFLKAFIKVVMKCLKKNWNKNKKLILLQAAFVWKLEKNLTQQKKVHKQRYISYSLFFIWNRQMLLGFQFVYVTFNCDNFEIQRNNIRNKKNKFSNRKKKIQKF